MRYRILGLFCAVIASGVAISVAGCGGGSSNPSTTATAAASATYVPTGPPATTVPVGTASPNNGSVANGNISVLINFPQATTGSATLSLSGSTSVPSLSPPVTAYTPPSGATLFYVVIEPSASVTFPNYPQFIMTDPAATPQNNNFFAAVYTDDPSWTNADGQWQAQFLGAASNSGENYTYPTPNPSAPLTFNANDYYVFALYYSPS
ncbi:MAG TPA: hypothetical protein VMD47_12230 [Candidatus Acidoferrales bacterium]|nr:hypothetical protein [Candidatus Acidoferrales bacterium]